MAILNYEYHTNVVTHHDALAKIKTFALAQGWIIKEWQANKKWEDQGGGVYGWSAGSESFLAIESPGYGSQTLHYRIRSLAEGLDGNHEWLEIGAVLAAHIAIETIGTHPVQQHNLKSNYKVSWKPASIPEMWIFGNGKQILVFARFDEKFTQCMCFGTVELYNLAENEGNWIGHSQIDTSTKWHEYLSSGNNFVCPADEADSVLYDSILKTSSGYACEIQSNYNNQVAGGFSVLTRALQFNNYAGTRVLVKPKCFIKRDSDEVFFPIGELPIYRFYHPGLSPGQELDYGSSSFLAFPGILLLDRFFGIAVQIS